MFTTNDYTILSWTRSLDVFGVVMQERGERLAVTAITESQNNEDDLLAESLKKCYRELSPSKDSLVVLSGHIDQGIYLELKLPNLKSVDIDQLLEFELARRIPFDVEDLVWCHEVVDGTFDEKTGKVTFRVFAVPAENWTSMISKLQLSGVKADLFMPVFMSATGDREHYLPTMIGDFSLSATNEHGIREFEYTFNPSNGVPDISSLIEDNEYYQNVNNPRFIPALLCGSYIMKKRVKHTNSQLELPKAMKPQRLRNANRAFWSSFVLVSILVISAGARVYLGNSSRLRALKNEQNHVSERLDKLDKNEKKNVHVNSLIEKIGGEDLGEHDLIIFLGELTRLLPNSMRLSRFNMRNSSIEISIIYDNSCDAVIQAIRANPHFDVLSVRKSSVRNVTSANVKLGIVKDGR